MDISRHRALWYLALALVASRLLVVGFAVNLNGHDALRYWQEAVNLVQYGTFSSFATPHPAPDAHDMPGYPLVLAGLLLIFKKLALVAKAAGVLNAVAFTVAAIEVYALVILAGGTPRVAAWAMALLGVFPEGIPYSVFNNPDAMFMPVFLAAILFAVWFLKEPRPWRLWLGFALLGASILIKPIGLFFAVVIVAAACLRYARKHPRALATGLIGGLLLEAAVMAPWLLRNYRDFRSFSPTAITGTNLYIVNYRYMLLDKGMPPDQVDALLESQLKRAAAETPGYNENGMVQAKVFQRLALKGIAADPLAYARTVLKRYPRLYEGSGALDLLDILARTPRPPEQPVGPWYARHPAAKPLRIAMGALMVLMYALIVAGAIVLFKRRMWRPLLLAGIPILYFSAIYGPVTASRYRFAMDPFFAIVAAYGATTVVSHWFSEPVRH